MASSTGERLLLSALGLCSGAFLALALALWLIDPLDYLAVGPSAHVTTEATKAPLVPPLELPPIGQFAAIVERPIFTATRRAASPQPAAPSAPAAADGLLLGRYQVIGVVVAPQSRLVLLKRVGGAETIRLEEGEEIDGWTLVQVTRDDLVLESGGRREKIVVRGNSKDEFRLK